MSGWISSVGNFINDYRLWLITPVAVASIASAAMATAVNKDNPTQLNKAAMAVGWTEAVLLAR